MLLQFAVTNYLSFKDETLFSMVPARRRGQKHKEHVLRDRKGGKAVSALPLAVIYGANASGKSNFVNAIAFAQKLIVDGTRGKQSISVTPFKLSAQSTKKPSRFEFVFKHDGVLYTYGFAATSTQVEEEWLFAVRNVQEVRLFERVTRADKAIVETGNQLASTKAEKQRLDFVAQGTRPNQLFLSEAAERNVEELSPVIRWFTDYIRVIVPRAKYGPLEQRAYKDTQFRSFLTDYVGAAGTGITEVVASQEEFDPARHLSGIPAEIQERILAELKQITGDMALQLGESNLALSKVDGKIVLLKLETRHASEEGKAVTFALSEESDGTRRLLHLAPCLLDLRKSERVYVIDELDRSLHPLLCRMFLEQCIGTSSKRRPKGQVILTTHEASLLDGDLLRHDEVWFTEMDRLGATHMTSLAEYKVRSDLRLEKGYLQGRFGAIPIIGDMPMLDD